MIKHFILLLVIITAATQTFGQTLFTYGSSQVSKAEFLKAYNKNKTPVADKEKALREYLDLYTKFKLKVQAAKEVKLDTLEQMKYDLQNFRSQVEESYLQDDKAIEALLDEAIQRSQKDIHLLHFSVAINNKMAASDTVKAHKAIEEVRADLLKGKTNYDEIVSEVSSEIMPVKGTDVGYVTVLTLPYEMETLIYGLKPGDVSMVYRTKSALHVFKNADERPSAGKWKIAQILFAIPPDVSQEELKVIEKRADSVYGLLQAGADFAATAKEFSEDRLTYLNGGEMAEFGTGKFDLPFETAVFSLQKNGDISKPIFTGYGYHIVKRLQQQPTPADKLDENFTANLKQLILKDSRINASKASFTKTLLAKTGYKRNAAVKDALLFRYADSVTATGVAGSYPINKSVIFSFTKQSVTGRDWLNFVKDYKLNQDVYKGENNSELLDKYIHTTTIEYYRKHLEEYNEEFKYQLQEFKEGNMLFEIMERNVWTKASNDSVGLKKYYESNKAKYQWAESATVYLFNCSNSKAADEAAQALKNGKNWKQIAEESDATIQSDSGRYELSQLQLPAGTTVNEGLISTPVVNSGDNTASFVQILKLYPANLQRNFEEARGLVINDYQNFLEEKWVALLKKKYPVKVNNAVFESILK